MKKLQHLWLFSIGTLFASAFNTQPYLPLLWASVVIGGLSMCYWIFHMLILTDLRHAQHAFFTMPELREKANKAVITLKNKRDMHFLSVSLGAIVGFLYAAAAHFLPALQFDSLWLSLIYAVVTVPFVWRTLSAEFAAMNHFEKVEAPALVRATYHD